MHTVGRLWSHVNSELNRKAVVENMFMTDPFTSDPRFKEYMGLQCQGNHERVEAHIRRKEKYTSAMIRKLVNGFYS